MTTATPPLSSILCWIWGFGPDFMPALHKAVDENDGAAIQIGREKLEDALKKLNPSTYSGRRDEGKYETAKAEYEAKIATVLAIQSGKSEDWTAASTRYDDLAQCLSSLASGCGPTEDIAEIMFRSEAKTAAGYAAVCMVKARGDTPEAHKEVLRSEAVAYVDSLGPSLGYDMTYDPVYPKGRNDVCAIRRLAENGSTYGFDTIYLLWKNNEGEIQHRELDNSRRTKDYLDVSEVIANGDDVTVKYSSGGCFSGKPWSNESKSKVA